MQLIPKKAPANFNIFLFGDDHEGTEMRHVNGWDTLCDMLESPWNGIPPRSNFAIDHGDIIEAIKVDDKRYDFKTRGTAENVGEQRENAIKHRMPIKNHLVAILEGNHPWKHKHHEDITEIVARAIDVPYGTWSCVVAWKGVKSLMFKSFHTHGGRSITSCADDPIRIESNMSLSLKRLLKRQTGDCILMAMGHTHKLLVVKPRREMYIRSDDEKMISEYTSSQPNAKYIHPDGRWYINTGSFLKKYSEMGRFGYAEQAGYDPVGLGFVICEIRDRIPVAMRRVLLGQHGGHEIETVSL